MARYTHIVLARGVADRKQDFLHWYEEVHLPEVSRLPAVVSARLLVVDKQFGAEALPPFDTIALYELDAETPDHALHAMLNPPADITMTMTDAIDGAAITQFIALPVKAIE